MDDETRRYLDAMMARINDQFERVLNRIGALEQIIRSWRAWK